jgi:hypothetical protein
VAEGHGEAFRAFITHDLYAWCQRERVTFTRSRPYQKNDSAHVERNTRARR